jgi:hypothetical protein
MNRLLTLAAGILATLILMSGNCDKNDNPAPSNTDYLTRSPWKFSKATASGIDISAQIPACFKDNSISFAINGTGTISEGTLACVPPAPPTFTWTFQNNGTQLNLSTPLLSGGSGTFNIVTLNDVNLVISQSVTIPPATTPVTVEITFIH